MDDVTRHNLAFDNEVVPKLAAFDAATAAGGKPALTIFTEANSERPPTPAWDGLIASGAAHALEPNLFLILVLFYTRQESVGKRSVRYNDFTEQRVCGVRHDASMFYDPATKCLKPEFAAYVDRLRDLQVFNQDHPAGARIARRAGQADEAPIEQSRPSRVVLKGLDRVRHSSVLGVAEIRFRFERRGGSSALLRGLHWQWLAN